MNAPAISIAMAVYNGSRFLSDQLASFLDQSALPDELIVVDDASTDETPDIIRDFKDGAPFPVKYFRNAKNLGATASFDAAISLCSGELVFLADQDDIWLSHKLATIASVFEKDAAVCLVLSNANVVSECLKPLGYTVWEQSRFTGAAQRRVAAGHAYATLLKGNFATGCTMAFRRAFQPFLSPIPPSWVHDGWIALIVGALCPVHAISEPLVLYRQHTNNTVGANARTLGRVLRAAKRTQFGFFAEEFDRYSQAYRRLADVGCRPENLALLAVKLQHLRFRADLSDKRAFRVVPILLEMTRGRYRRYSTGWKSALRDLLI
jgi:glycosyltransferase involved in cell wall biosynthesis